MSAHSIPIGECFFFSYISFAQIAPHTIATPAEFFAIKCFCRYYEDDLYDRRSIQRSLSQPSLARSATEFTERWVIPDDVSDDSAPERPTRNTSRLVCVQNSKMRKFIIMFSIYFYFVPSHNRLHSVQDHKIPSMSSPKRNTFNKVRQHSRQQIPHHRQRIGTPILENKANV